MLLNIHTTWYTGYTEEVGLTHIEWLQDVSWVVCVYHSHPADWVSASTDPYKRGQHLFILLSLPFSILKKLLSTVLMLYYWLVLTWACQNLEIRSIELLSIERDTGERRFQLSLIYKLFTKGVTILFSCNLEVLGSVLGSPDWITFSKSPPPTHPLKYILMYMKNLQITQTCLSGVFWRSMRFLVDLNDFLVSQNC